MKKVLFLMLFLTIAGIADMDAQVKIGENAAPVNGAILDLNGGTKGGLLLPNVDITDFEKIPDTFSDGSVAGKGNRPELAGMVVWNTRKGWEGIYAWDGNEWKCFSGTPPAVNPETLPPGAGLFTGRACFDVAQINSDACGDLTSRQAEPLENGTRADFCEMVTRNQTYTFTPSGKVSNVRFYYIEDEANKNKIVESISGGNPANNIDASKPVTCDIVYKSDLNEKASGKSTAEALKVAIYVIYNNGPTNNGTDVTLRLNVAIKDCACCGAFTTSGSWLNFMCYNLGAENTLATPEQIKNAAPEDTYGSYFQWGQNKYWTAGTISGWSSTGNNPDDLAWGFNTVKNTSNDPCPEGYRVPSASQWMSLATFGGAHVPKDIPNKWRWFNTNTTGYQVGTALFLPAARYLKATDGTVMIDLVQACYWTTGYSANINVAIYFHNDSNVEQIGWSAAVGGSIRCVEE